tara:strand:- start:1751 stop:2917 length:1167 start_codon:yes stop_codon:yes gene_type:complete
MIISYFPFLIISLACLLNIFSYGYLPNFLFEGFIFVQSVFIYLLSFSTKLKYGLTNSIIIFLLINLIFLLIASLAQLSIYPISRFVGLLLGITSFYFLGNNISKKQFFLFIRFLSLCCYFGILISFLTGDFTIYQFSGFFENANNFGRFFSYFFVIFSGFLLKYRREISQSFSIQLYLLIALSFGLLTVSSARAAIGASLLPLVFYLLFICFSRLKLFIQKRKKSDFQYLIFTFFIIAIVIVIGIFYFQFVNTKSVFKTLQRGDYTGGRVILWSLTLTQLSNWGIDLLGSKDNFLEFFGGDPHSTYLNFALKNGIIPSISYFLGLLAIISRNTFLSLKNSANNYLLVYFLSIQIFSYWVFESANSILPFWLIFFFLAYERRENKKLLI